MDGIETLKAARKLIEHEEDWFRADPRSPWGNKMENGRLMRCSGAALYACGTAWPSDNPAWEALRDAMNGNISLFNGTHTHAEVLAAFDEAIRDLELGGA